MKERRELQQWASRTELRDQSVPQTCLENVSKLLSALDSAEAEIATLRARIVELETAAHYNAWLLSGDTGMSSKAIFNFMRTGEKSEWTPADPSDLGRCLRLLERFPEWRERMPEMVECSQMWANMVPYWDVLESTLLNEVGSIRAHGSAPRTFRLMKAIHQGNPPELLSNSTENSPDPPVGMKGRVVGTRPSPILVVDES